MSLKNRYEDKSELVAALANQRIVKGDVNVAEQFAAEGELFGFPPGKDLIVQGQSDRDVYFLLTGKTQIYINAHPLHFRLPDRTVGEMSAINPAKPRTSTIRAVEETVAWKVSHTHFKKVLDANIKLWPELAIDMTSRLEERNQYVKEANIRPRVFVISSAEALDAAKRIRVGLQHVADVDVWSDEMIFMPGGYPLEDLKSQLDKSDFAVAVAQDDDILITRGRETTAPRANVIFELGYFMARLGRDRTFLVVPKKEIELPSDFRGLTPLAYKFSETLDELPRVLGPAIDSIEFQIKKLGVFLP